MIDAGWPPNGMLAATVGHLVIRRRTMQHGAGRDDPDNVSALLEPLAGASMVSPRDCPTVDLPQMMTDIAA